jgi:hypothetical protein
MQTSKEQSELEPFAVKLSSLRWSNLGFSSNDDLFLSLKVAENHLKSYADANQALLKEREKMAKELEQKRLIIERFEKEGLRLPSKANHKRENE